VRRRKRFPPFFGAGDGLSAFNLLWWRGHLLFIDFPQAVDIAENPSGLDFLHRDVINVCTWFGRRGVEHDPEVVFADLVTYAFRSEGIHMLINEGFRFETRRGSFWLAGVDDYMVGKTDVPAALRGSFPDEMKLLLAHNPIIFREAARSGVDLTLSGHTHGGQIKLRDDEKRILPQRKLKAGLHTRRNSQVYITRGIGTVVVPMRYQCPPEISLLELRAAE